MKKINLETDCKRIHFIGIGGISMSGLAEILYNGGYIVSGSDNKKSEITERLVSKGIKVSISHDEKNITDDIDLIVFTAAIKGDNPELIEGKKKHIRIIDRAYLLGLIMRGYKYPISIAGTHGKTTTTAMVSEIFLNAGTDPTISLGGVLQSISGSFRIGESDYFILESCEYFDSFLKFYPFVGIILNIEEDHLDYFKDLDSIYESFHKFALNIPSDGYLIINNNIKNIEKITDGLHCTVVTYGNEFAHWNATNISYDENGFGSYDLVHKAETLLKISLHARGIHNIHNSLAAAVAAYLLKISIDSIELGLLNYGGTKRRFEVKGSYNGITIIDDYAHHPTEIKATIAAALNSSHRSLWCVFQPHTFSRTRFLLNEFSEAFDLADKIVILDIYSARESNSYAIHSTDLVDKIKAKGKEVYYFDSFEKACEFLLNTLLPHDMLITMGAGDVYLLGETILRTALSTLSTDL